MKNIKILIISLFIGMFYYSGTFASSFSDLDSLCTWSESGIHESKPESKLILKHINKRITIAESYLKLDDYIYMVGNTFTDSYRFLGSYLLRYDCLEKKTEKLSGLLKANLPQERGFIQYSEVSNTIGISHAGRNTSRIGYWIYDLEKQALRKINVSKIKKIPGKNMTIAPDLSSYDGMSIDIKILYYTTNKDQSTGTTLYHYENLDSPTIYTYTF